MERLICGEDVEESKSSSGSAPFCAYSMVVERGHGECGDSAFVFVTKTRLIAGVFDGVSGDPGAAAASSEAAKAVLSHLRGLKAISEKDVEEALSAAHCAILLGATTASILILESNGSFIISSIGDSPVFSVTRGGAASLELPLARVVSDGDSILKFFHFRNLVSSVLGSDNELAVNIRSGRMKAGESFIMASDGLSDNLEIEVEDGYVLDSSGEADLRRIIRGKKGPKEAVKSIMAAIRGRMKGGRKESARGLLVPKDDDISIVAVRFGGTPGLKA